MRRVSLLALVALPLAASAVSGCNPPTTSVTMDAAVDDDVGNDAFIPDAYVPDVFLPDDPGAARAIFVLAPPTGSFFDLPWPTNLRTDAMGHPALSDFPNPRSTLVAGSSA